MSWSSSKHRVFKTLSAIGALGLAIVLGGCGFTPLYGTTGVGAAGGKLSGVAVAPVIGGAETGLQMRELLLDQISGSREASRPTHTLLVNLTSSEGSVLVQPDSYATRYNIYVSAKYRLVDAATNAIVTRGDVQSISAYNVVESEYATLVGKRDAERRAANVVAKDIAMRLAVYFKHGSGAVEGTPLPNVPPTTTVPNSSGLPSALNPTGEALPGTAGKTGESLSR